MFDQMSGLSGPMAMTISGLICGTSYSKRTILAVLSCSSNERQPVVDDDYPSHLCTVGYCLGR